MADKSTKTATGAGFEDTLGKIEKIVKEIESGRLPLEEVVGKFRDASKLISQCKDILGEVEQQIKVMEKEKYRSRRGG